MRAYALLVWGGLAALLMAAPAAADQPAKVTDEAASPVVIDVYGPRQLPRRLPDLPPGPPGEEPAPDLERPLVHTPLGRDPWQAHPHYDYAKGDTVLGIGEWRRARADNWWLDGFGAIRRGDAYTVDDLFWRDHVGNDPAVQKRLRGR